MRKYILLILTNFVLKIYCGGINGDFTPVANNLIEQIPVFGPEFYVSFEVKLSSFPSSSWRNIINFENVISIVIRSANNQIRIQSTVDGGIFNTDFSGTALNTYHRIEVLQTQVLDKVDTNFAVHKSELTEIS